MQSNTGQIPQVIKVGGTQANNVLETIQVIEKLKICGPLTVVLSAPNSQKTFRTTNVLIEAAGELSKGNIGRSKELLHSVQDFVLNTVCSPFHDEPVFRKIEKDIKDLFHRYFRDIDLYGRDRSPTAQFFTKVPKEKNDFVASVLRKPAHVCTSRGGSGRLYTSIPFMELGENLSVVIYTHLTGGEAIMSRTWIGEDIKTIQDRVRNSQETLIVSGALRIDRNKSLLELNGRGYSDVTASLLAFLGGSTLLVHKDYPILTIDPKMTTNGIKQPVKNISMGALRSCMHPLVGVQFLNGRAFSHGEPRNIAIGDFNSSNVTQVVQDDLDNGLPIIQKGPNVSLVSGKTNFADVSLEIDSGGSHCLISVIDHSPNGSRLSQISSTLGSECIIGSLNPYTTSVLVHCDQAENTVRRLYQKMKSV